MSKKQKEGMPDIVIVFDDSYLSHIEGKLLTLIEALGLPEVREKSVKSLVRGAIWDEAHDVFGHPMERKEYYAFINRKF
jgi:hypothetical protein